MLPSCRSGGVLHEAARDRGSGLPVETAQREGDERAECSGGARHPDRDLAVLGDLG